MKKNTHIAFTKPFWKLLGFSVLSFAFLYGGIILAATYVIDGCELKRDGQLKGEICKRLLSSTSSDAEGKSFDFTVPDVSDATGLAKGGADHDAALIGETIKFVNNSDKEIFVPVRSQAELYLSFRLKEKSLL